jgi:hypothetical protein
MSSSSSQDPATLSPRSLYVRTVVLPLTIEELQAEMRRDDRSDALHNVSVLLQLAQDELGPASGKVPQEEQNVIFRTLLNEIITDADSLRRGRAVVVAAADIDGIQLERDVRYLFGACAPAGGFRFSEEQLGVLAAELRLKYYRKPAAPSIAP